MNINKILINFYYNEYKVVERDKYIKQIEFINFDDVDIDSLILYNIKQEMINFFNYTLFIDNEDKQNCINIFLNEINECININELYKINNKYLKYRFNFILSF